MLSTAVLLAILVVVTITDLRAGKIYNWATYSGSMVGFLASGLATLTQHDTTTGEAWDVETLGFIPIGDALVGFLACGVLMLVCYVFFAGSIGGGDVKLVAMIGAYLGLYLGLEALLWTFVIGGTIALIQLIWRYGAGNLVKRVFLFLAYVLRVGPHARLTEQEREPLQTNLHLAPAAALAVVIVRFQLVEWF